VAIAARAVAGLGDADSGAKRAFITLTASTAAAAAWFLAARDAGLRYIESPLVLVDRRVHAGNKGRMPGAHSQYLPVLKQRLDRRRAAAK
jgi:hypothetical protein